MGGDGDSSEEMEGLLNELWCEGGAESVKEK